MYIIADIEKALEMAIRYVHMDEYYALLISIGNNESQLSPETNTSWRKRCDKNHVNWSLKIECFGQNYTLNVYVSTAVSAGLI